jgi:hypothetical protein
MSQENVEILKACIDAYNRDDWDAVFKDVAPGAEIDWSRSVGPYGGVYSLDQFRRFVAEFRKTWNPLGWSPTNSSKPVISY